MTDNKFYLLGCASGLAGADIHSGDGPLAIRHSKYLSTLSNAGIDYEWTPMVSSPDLSNSHQKRLDELVASACLELAKEVSPFARQKKSFCIVGGDHSCAIGTWSGVYDALHEQGDIGLIWFDAHMDSHTPETSETKRIHGMPLACLLGYGFPTLTSVLHATPKLKPQNVCLIGVRSFESGEAELLRRLNVRVYEIDEVLQRGFDVVLQEAVELVSKNTIGFGLSLDIDGIDPIDAPGVDVPEENGVRAVDFCEGLKKVAADPRLIAVEVVEFDPTHDIEQKTEKLVTDILEIVATGAIKAA